MHSEIIETAYSAVLHGFHGCSQNESVPVIGKRLMDRMWQEIQKAGLPTKGMNHWVYLPDSAMFAGVELADGATGHPDTLEILEVRVERYLRHVHRGLCSRLPEIWPVLLSGLGEIQENAAYPHLEIYGHWNPDPAKCATTILIGLSSQR